VRRYFVLLALIAVVVAGCKPLAPGAPSASPSASPQSRAGSLYEVHDPGQVTGSVPASCHALAGPEPDPSCTPGAIDPAVTQANIATTICRRGYTATVRPPENETSRLKSELYVAYGITAGTVSELDHLVPLELGGANDVKNLWPEVGPLPNPKDKVENALNDAVCSGKVPLAAAQKAIAANWQTAEQALGVS
jgi:hypothetical protein